MLVLGDLRLVEGQGGEADMDVRVGGGGHACVCLPCVRVFAMRERGIPLLHTFKPCARVGHTVAWCGHNTVWRAPAVGLSRLGNGASMCL